MRLSRGLVGGLAGAVVTLAAGVVVVTLGPMAHAATAPTPPFNALTVRGTNADTVLPAGANRAFDASNSTITGGPTDPAGGIQLSVTPQAGGGAWSAVILPPTGVDLTATTYQTAATPDAEHAGFTLTGEGGHCDGATGSVNIRELLHDDAGAVNGFAVTYTYQCASGDVPMSGEIRFNSQTPYIADVTSPSGSIDFGLQDIGENGTAKTVTLTSFGSDPLQASGSLTDTKAFTLTSDTCKDKSLPYGETCTVTVTPHPTTTAGPETAELVISDNTGASALLLPLSVNGKVGAKGTFYPVGPARILDTRIGLGAPKAALGPGGVIHLPVANRGGVPLHGASAVVLNVTVTLPTASSFLTVWPSGSTRPTASNLNFPAHWTGANSVTVPVGTSGRVDIFNAKGSVQVIADVLGFYAADDSILSTPFGLGGQFQPTIPGRFIDSRVDLDSPLDGNTWIRLGIPFPDAEVNGHVRALAVNITAVSPAATGYLASWNGVGTPPNASTLDFTKGKTVANFAVVPVAPCDFCGDPNIAMFAVFNGSASPTHFIVDVFGFYDDSTLGGLPLRFRPLTPTRIVDSRIGLGGIRAIGANTAVSVHAPSTVAGDNTWALQMNLTAVSPTVNTFLTVWPDDPQLPLPAPADLVSNLNPTAGSTVPNAVVTLIGPNNNFLIYNSRGSVNVVADVGGSFELGVFPAGTLAGQRANAAISAPSGVKRSERRGPTFGGALQLGPAG